MTDESHQKMISNLGDEEKLISSSLPSEMNPDFLVIRIVARIVFSVIRQCWAVCGALLIMFCFLFWNYGGFAALLLLFFSALGTSSSFTFNQTLRSELIYLVRQIIAMQS